MRGTRVVADLYSRRRSVLIGCVVVGVALMLQGGWPSFWPTLAAQVIWGIGYTFVSGAIQAWITDEIGEDAVQPVFTGRTWPRWCAPASGWRGDAGWCGRSCWWRC